MSTVDLHAASEAVAHLRRMADADGSVSTELVRAVARRFGRSERTIWFWLSNGVPNGTPPPKPGKEIVHSVARENGNRKRAWHKLRSTGAYCKSYRQFLRDLDLLSPIVHASITEGVKEGIHQGLYVKAHGEQRLDRVLFDHTEADIRLRRTRSGVSEMFRPWVTLLLDSATRMILAAVVTEGDGVRGDPPTESIVALLATAIRGVTAADGTFVGGVPRLVQFDNAKAHLAEAMLNGYVELGIASHAIRPGSPWEDGKVERLMRTLGNEFLSAMPGYTKALTDRYAREPWKPEDCMPIEEFNVRLQAWIDHYNYERQHSVLGSTPFEAWCADTGQIITVDTAMLRHGFLAESKPRKVSKNGLRFKNIDYIHPKLQKVVGRKVHLRFLPNDETFVEVFIDGQHLCTAVPHERLPMEQRRQVVRNRTNELKSVDHIVKTSRRRYMEDVRAGATVFAPDRDPHSAGTPDRTSSTDDLLDLLDDLAQDERDTP